jgi:inorganic pyrophosphatase
LDEEKYIKVNGWHDKSFAKRIIMESIGRYKLDMGIIHSLFK